MPVHLTTAQSLIPATAARASELARTLETTVIVGDRLSESGVAVSDVGADRYTPGQDSYGVHISLTDSANAEKFGAAKAAAELTNKPLVIDPAQGVDAVTRLDLQDRGVHISDADARDSVKYRRAKAIAAKAGKSLVIDPREPEVAAHNEPGVLVMSNDDAKVPAAYRAAKAEAERTGKRLVIA